MIHFSALVLLAWHANCWHLQVDFVKGYEAFLLKIACVAVMPTVMVSDKCEEFSVWVTYGWLLTEQADILCGYFQTVSITNHTRDGFDLGSCLMVIVDRTGWPTVWLLSDSQHHQSHKIRLSVCVTFCGDCDRTGWPFVWLLSDYQHHQPHKRQGAGAVEHS